MDKPLATVLFFDYAELCSGTYFKHKPSPCLWLHRRDSQFITSDCVCINICLILLSHIIPQQFALAGREQPQTCYLDLKLNFTLSCKINYFNYKMNNLVSAHHSVFH